MVNTDFEKLVKGKKGKGKGGEEMDMGRGKGELQEG